MSLNNKKNTFPFRQVHLDFHNSELIKSIGSKFNKEDFKKKLVKANVQLINIFAKCHHGWAYFPSKTIPMHPNLNFDLLGEMIDACRESSIRYQIYISAGLDENYAKMNKDEIGKNKDGTLRWTKDWENPGYHEICLNTKYLDVLKKQVSEIVRKYKPEGIFLDIVGERMCYCKSCLIGMRKSGYNKEKDEDVIEYGRHIYNRYFSEINKLSKSIHKKIKIFHNQSHISKGRRDFFESITHFDIESLPTGTWGYSHMPMTAKYVSNFNKDYTSMTGKFNKSWGEFGGFKNVNALKYECALNLAFGAKTNIGDQMHPLGFLDDVTYSLIGEAFSWMKPLEKYSVNAKQIADVGLLTLESINNFLICEKGILISNNIPTPENPFSEKMVKSDNGAYKMLQESNILFDIIDLECDLEKYKVIIMPDKAKISQRIASIINKYIKKGGKVLLTGSSGLSSVGEETIIDIGINIKGKQNLRPDYYFPDFSYYKHGKTSFVMYGASYKYEIKDKSIEIFGNRIPSYFNRRKNHFSSHAQTPDNPKIKEKGIAIGNKGAYIPWEIFRDYYEYGHSILKMMFIDTLKKMINEKITIKTNFGQQGVMTLSHQEEMNRFVNHFVYAIPVKKGLIEVIEDINPLYDVQVKINLENIITPKSVFAVKSNKYLDFKINKNNLTYTVPKIDINEIILINY